MSQTKAQLIDTLVASLLPASDSSVDIGSNGVRFANIYGDTLYGDGSNLTGITSTTINSNADNRLITGSGSANTLNGESGLTYNGSTLAVTGAITGTGGLSIDGATVFNESGANVDFRVEGDTEPNLLFVDASADQVSIGTSSPSDIFDVVHAGNTAAGISIRNTNNSQGSAFAQLLVSGGDNAKGRVKIEANGAFHTIDEDNNGNLIIEDNGTERLRLDSSGNVLIGTTSATAEFTVQGGGTVASFEGTGGSGGIAIRDSDAGTFVFLKDDGGTFSVQTSGSSYSDKFSILPDGKVGIGTTSPDDLLEISSSTADKRLLLTKASSGTANEAGMTLHFQNFGPAATGRNDGTLIGRVRFSASQPTSGGLQDAGAIECRADGTQTGNNTRSRLSFLTVDSQTATERMRIDKDGNVGIGTTSPTQAKFVSSSSSGTQIAAIKDNNGASISLGGPTQPRVLLETVPSASDLRILTAGGSTYGSASYTERIRFLQAGGITFNGDTAAANALDDYEEGTWTPAYNAGSASSACFAAGISYNTGGQTGLYTKIGNVVYFRFNIDPASSGLTAKSGILQINGLPFTAANTSNINSGAAFYMYTNAFGSSTSTNLPMATVINNNSVIQFYQTNGSAFAGTSLSAPQNAIQMVGMYHVA